MALLRDFDIFNAAGGPLIAAEKTFDNLEPNAEGKLMLTFVPVKDSSSDASSLDSPQRSE